MSEQTEIQQLKDEIVHLKADILTLMRNQSSRRGADGVSIKGDRGDRGTDAVVKIVQDGQTIRVLSNQGQAEIVSVPGAKGDSVKGDPGISPNVEEIVSRVVQLIVAIPELRGAQGATGTAPSVEEIVSAVIKHINSRLQ